MQDDATSAALADTVQCVKDLCHRFDLNEHERKFVNEQAVALSEAMMQAWASARYAGKKRIRACCATVSMAMAMTVVHKTATDADAQSPLKRS
jgi:hypothetical protein